MTVRQTSRQEGGQIYLPAVNWLLYAGVLILMLAFESSNKLATAYGLAVTGTLLLTTTLFLILAGAAWHWPRWRLVLIGVVFGGIELTFFGANLTKVVHGGWLPLLIAILVVTAMMTWQRGRVLVTERRIEAEGPLQTFVDLVRTSRIQRVPGTAVYPHPGKETAPLALRANTAFNNVVHEHVVIVSIQRENVPFVPPDQRLSVDELGLGKDGIVHLTVRTGFSDEQDIPEVLRAATGMSDELTFDPDGAYYFLSRLSIERGPEPGMATWRKRIFITMSHNAASPAVDFHLPPDRTVIMGSSISL